MTIYAGQNFQAADDAGNVLTGAKVEVRLETTAGLARVYLDRAGATQLANPADVDTIGALQGGSGSDGYFRLYAAGGAYKVRIYTGDSGDPTFERIWRHVAIGRAAETDALSFAASGAWDSGTTYSAGDVVSHADGGDDYLFVSRVDSNLNNEPDAATPDDTVYWMLLPSIAGSDGVAGILWQFDGASQADSDPGAGKFRLNNATVASATAIYLDNLANGGGDVSAEVDTWDDSTSTVKGKLILRSTTVETTFAIFSISGTVTDGTGYRKLTATHVAGTGTFTDADVFAVSFIPKGDKGDTGNTGSTGSAGADGADGTDPGIMQAYSTTTAEADPGAGIFRFNDATIASVTEGYFDNLENGGGDVSAFLDTWDDSTNTIKGHLIFRDVADPTVFAIFTVSGTVTDGTGYRKVTLGHVASNGTFTNTNVFSIQFSRAGNKGADGAGSGDMAAATYDPQAIAGDAFDTDNHTSGTTNKVYTASEQTKLAGIETSADVTDAANVASAGAAMLATENQACTGGVEVTSKSLGTFSTGTNTLDMGDRSLQHYTNDGAHTLAPGTVTGSAIVDITNGASAGAITTSGFTFVDGDSFTTTNGHKFRCHVSVGNAGSLLIVQAFQ